MIIASDLNFHIKPGGTLRGQIRVPGDKSISHRSLILASIAEGITTVTNFLEGADTLATLTALRQMGVKIEGPSAGIVKVHGVGLQGLQKPHDLLNLGNSGTSLRLLAGLLAGQKFQVQLTGDESLSKRPMRRVTDPLTQMGARITTSAAGTPPLLITPTARLQGIDYILPVPSAQVKSSLLLAGLNAVGETCVHEPVPTRDHTERMLSTFGYKINCYNSKICLNGGGKLNSCDLKIPADISSAAFFLVGATIAPGSDLLLTEVGINPTRIGIINVLRAMGADIEILEQTAMGAEPVANLRVRSAPLHGINIPPEQVALTIDEFPALFIAAACAEGETVLSGAAELRVKESDRIQVMAEGLQSLGIQAEPRLDGMKIIGGSFKNFTLFKDGYILNSYGDHRVAMAFAMAGLRAQIPITIRDCTNVGTSFPHFIAIVQAAGLQITQKSL